MLENAVPAAAGEPDAEDIGTRQLEITRPPPIPGGSETRSRPEQCASLCNSAQIASQQGGEGYVDPEFEVQTRSERGKLESNGKVIYISGLAPSGSGSSSKVDTWSRIKAMRLPGAEEGGSGSLMHARVPTTSTTCGCSRPSRASRPGRSPRSRAPVGREPWRTRCACTRTARPRAWHPSGQRWSLTTSCRATARRNPSTPPTSTPAPARSRPSRRRWRSCTGATSSSTVGVWAAHSRT